MALKKYLPALENVISVEEKLFDNVRSISRKLFLESESFRERNGLAIVASSIKNKRPIKVCCPQCLKAHLLKKAEEMDFDKVIINILKDLADYETGHCGYYLDEGKLIRV